ARCGRTRPPNKTSRNWPPTASSSLVPIPATRMRGERRRPNARSRTTLAALIASRQPKILTGKRVLVPPGPTYEPIDPVRGITNLSSGKMGLALAQAAAEAGANVIVVAGPSDEPTPANVVRVDVQSAAEMADAVLSRIDGADIFIGVAAVADYTPQI